MWRIGSKLCREQKTKKSYVFGQNAKNVYVSGGKEVGVGGWVSLHITLNKLSASCFIEVEASYCEDFLQAVTGILVKADGKTDRPKHGAILEESLLGTKRLEFTFLHECNDKHTARASIEHADHTMFSLEWSSSSQEQNELKNMWQQLAI